MTDVKVPLDENTRPSLDRVVDDILRRGGNKNQERSVEKEV